MTKRIVKIITFYDDGTFTESTPTPVTPMMPSPLNPAPFQIPALNNRSCPKCGIKMEGAMGYVCNNNPCPTGLGGSWCSTNE